MQKFLICVDDWLLIIEETTKNLAEIIKNLLKQNQILKKGVAIQNKRSEVVLKI